jgi:hypothetical protein
MSKILVTFTTQTQNDVELNGFMIMSEKEVETFEEIAMSINWPFVYNSGEDEVEFSSGDDFLSTIEFKEISNDEAKILKKLFGESFGVFIDIEFLYDVIGDDYEEDYD